MSINKKSIFTNWIFVTLGAILCCALWGSATPFIKLGYVVMFGGSPDIPSTILFAGIRFFFAGVLTVAIYSIARRRLLYPKPRGIKNIAIVGLFQTVIQYFFFYVGLANTSGAKGTVISGSSSFFAILISALIVKQEKLTPKKIIACVIGFLGIIAVNLNGLDFSMNLMGDAFVMFSAISLAISSVLMKIFSKEEDPVVISGYQFIMGGAVMVFSGLILGGRINNFDLSAFGIMVYLSLLSAVAYALWGILLKHNPVSRVTIFSFMTPVFGVLLTMLILPAESTVSPLNLIISLLLVSGGVFLLNYTHNSKQKPSAPEECTTESVSKIAADDSAAE